MRAGTPAAGGEFVVARQQWVQRSVHLAQWAMCALYVPVVLIGALVTPPVGMLIVAPAVVLVATGVLAGIMWTCRLHLPDHRRTLTVTAAAAGGLVPFAQGVELLQDFGTVIAMAVLGLVTVVGHRWWATNLDVPAVEDATRSATVVALREVLETMPLDRLLVEWRALQQA